MARRRFRLTEQQEAQLRQAFTACKDGPTRTRYQAVLLYGTGYPVNEIISITGCSRTSLMDWCLQYRTDGTEGLIDRRVGGNRAKLKPAELQDLRVRLHDYSPADLFGPLAATADGQHWTVPDLHRTIEKWYGVSYQSPTSMRRIFHHCGFSYQRPAKVFKSRSAAKVAEFEEQLEKKSSTSHKTPRRR
jgi:transposase